MTEIILSNRENDLGEKRKEKRLKIGWLYLLIISLGVAFYFLLIKGWEAMIGGFLITVVASYWIMFSFSIAPLTVEQKVFIKKNDVPFAFGGAIMFLGSCVIVLIGIMLINVPY